MKNSFKLFGIIAAIAIIGLFSTGCYTPPPSKPIHRADWAHHPNIPLMDYVVIGTIVLVGQRPEAVLATLMARAVDMGGHDIKHVRLSEHNRTSGLFQARGIWVTATAVVIKYTNETLWRETTHIAGETTVTTREPVIGGRYYYYSNGRGRFILFRR